MVRKIFNYTAHPIGASPAYPTGIVAYRPLILARIHASSGRSVQVVVLPDSGADSCVFPLSVALRLKLNLLHLPKGVTGGLGSQGNVTYYERVVVDLGGELRFDVFAGFTQGLDGIGNGLLGQRDFFKACNVEFRLSEGTFSLEKV